MDNLILLLLENSHCSSLDSLITSSGRQASNSPTSTTIFFLDCCLCPHRLHFLNLSHSLYWCSQQIAALLTKHLSPSIISKQGMSRPPWAKSLEYLRFPVTLHEIVPPLLMNNEHTELIFLGRCPTITAAFMTLTAYGSCLLSVSRAHTVISPITGLVKMVSSYTWLVFGCDSYRARSSARVQRWAWRLILLTNYFRNDEKFARKLTPKARTVKWRFFMLRQFRAIRYASVLKPCSNEFKEYAECVLQNYYIQYPPKTVSDAMELLTIFITEMHWVSPSE